jgi:hypothetical protein
VSVTNTANYCAREREKDMGRLACSPRRHWRRRRSSGRRDGDVIDVEDVAAGEEEDDDSRRCVATGFDSCDALNQRSKAELPVHFDSSLVTGNDEDGGAQ